MRLAAAFGRLKAGYKSRGFDYLVEAGLDFLPHNLLFFERNLLMVADSWEVAERGREGYEVRAVGPEDLSKATGFTFSVETLQRELREGSVGMAVLKEGRVVSWRWSATGALYIQYCNALMDTGSDGYYTSRVETVPEERRRGLAGLSLGAMRDHFLTLDRDLDYVLISTRNVRSQKVHEKLGYRTVGEIFVLNLLWTHFCFYLKWPFHKKRFSLTLRIPPKGRRIV